MHMVGDMLGSATMWHPRSGILDVAYRKVGREGKGSISLCLGFSYSTPTESWNTMHTSTERLRPHDDDGVTQSSSSRAATQHADEFLQAIWVSNHQWACQCQDFREEVLALQVPALQSVSHIEI